MRITVKDRLKDETLTLELDGPLEVAALLSRFPDKEGLRVLAYINGEYKKSADLIRDGDYVELVTMSVGG